MKRKRAKIFVRRDYFFVSTNQLWPARLTRVIRKQPARMEFFGFMVPPGKYLLKIEKVGYSAETINLTVSGVVINPSVELLYLPLAIKDVIKPGAPLTENIVNVVQNLGEQSVLFPKRFLKKSVMARVKPRTKLKR